MCKSPTYKGGMLKNFDRMVSNSIRCQISAMRRLMDVMDVTDVIDVMDAQKYPGRPVYGIKAGAPDEKNIA